MNEVLIYETDDRRVAVSVRLEGETVWLTQEQMSQLFGRERSVITKHLRNVFKEGELDPGPTCAKFAQVQTEGQRTVTREVDHYNLDVIISIGYRVKSAQGTRFRQWATRVLREHLVEGYTYHQTRLAERGLVEARQTLDLLARTLQNQALMTDEGRAVLDVVQQYSRTWHLLLAYDENRLSGQPRRPVTPPGEILLPEARQAIGRMRASLAAQGGGSVLFGQERGEQFPALLGAIRQTFGGKPLYPTAQARAAHLLYFVIKDHPFSDGNKRIGAFLFLHYLHLNGLLLRSDGQLQLADNAVVALALLIAESAASHKDLMIHLILNLLEDGAG